MCWLVKKIFVINLKKNNFFIIILVFFLLFGMCVIFSCMRRRPKFHTLENNIKKSQTKKKLSNFTTIGQLIAKTKKTNNNSSVINGAVQKLSPTVLNLSSANNKNLSTKSKFKVCKNNFFFLINYFRI